MAWHTQRLGRKPLLPVESRRLEWRWSIKGDVSVSGMCDSGRPVVVGLLIPLEGPAGIFGPSCELCAQLAVQELNRSDGILGREVELRVVNGGRPPHAVADDIDRLTRSKAIDALVGWHTSAVRQAVVPRLAGRIPYVYTALYEGGEAAPGVFMTGETPDRQVVAALRWMSQQAGVRRWTIVGDDYVWPRRTAAAVRMSAEASKVLIKDEIFVDLGSRDFTSTLKRLERSESDGVLMLLLGQDGVDFNRQFSQAGFDQRWVRLSPLMDENMLLATGADCTRGLYSTAGYFEALATSHSLEFGDRYSRTFGRDAPVLNSMGESCYEGVRLLAELARAAGSLEVNSLSAAAACARYGGPRGEMLLRDAHLQQDVYLAQATGVDLDVLASL